MAWVTIANVRGPRGYQGEGVVTSIRFRQLTDLPSMNVDDWVGIDRIGLYPVIGETIIGRPLGTTGYAFIVIKPIGSGGSVVQWIEYSGARRTFERIISTTVGNRTEWKLTSAPNRVGHHQLSQAGNSSLTDTEPSRHVREPVMFFSTIDTWELVFKNHNDQARTNYGELSFYEIFISKRKREANGEYGPNFETAPVSLGVPVATGSGSSRAYRILDIHYQLEANTDYILSYSYDTPGGTPNHMGIGGSYLGTNVAGRNAMDVSNVWSPYTPLDVYIKPTMSPDAPYMAFPGSSSETGLNTDYPLRDCWSWRYAEAHGAIPAMLGMSGSTLTSWNAGGHYIWTKMNVSAPVDKIVGNPGSNDLYIGATLAQMQERFIEFARLARQYLGGTFEATDVFPRAVESAAVKAVRLAFNAWLRTLPANILRVYDRASAVSGPDGLLRADFNSGDNTHLNTAGQRRLGASMISGIPKPDLVNYYRFAESAGRTMWAWDHINGREQLVYGDTGERDITALSGNVANGNIYIQRTGYEVTITVLMVKLVALAAGSSTDLFAPGAIPAGFRHRRTTWYPVKSNGATATGAEWRQFGATSSGWMPIYSGATLADEYRAVIKYTTTDPWPTSLPGTAVGVIPYQ